MKIAIVHDWLVIRGGAELVLERLLDMFPEADVFTLVRTISDEEFPQLANRKVTTSFIQKLPFGRTRYRSYLPLFPIAVEQFDLSEYDLVLSSSYAVAKGVLTGPDQIHISYVHSPVRYAWDLHHSYLREANLVRGPKSALVRAILHYIRLWDTRTANSVDVFLANSHFIARRIWKVYRREAQVVHPPVSLEIFQGRADKQDYYFTTARMVPYKKIPLIVEAFASMPDKRLIVAGDGPEMAQVRAKVAPNVELVGFVGRDQLVDYMQGAKAFVYAAEEDFGIVPVEAQACGTPVIAFGKGGALETVVEGRSGHFFYAQTKEALARAVENFERDGVEWNATRIRAHAEQFSVEAFDESIRAVVAENLPRNSTDRLASRSQANT